MEGQRVVSPVLVGRESELRLVLELVGRAPAVVEVEGEAGIGKTRLLAEVQARLGASAVTLVGRCPQIREPFPLGPVIEALRGALDELRTLRLRPLAGALRPLLPELSDVLPPVLDSLDDRSAERHRVFRAVVDVLDSLGTTRPVVLVLEDLHWADEHTLDFVAYLLADPPPRLALVLSFRTEDASPQLRALTARVPSSLAHERVLLGVLDSAQTGALTGAILGASSVSSEFAGYLWERTGGVPLAVEEVLALARARGLVAQGPHGWARKALADLDVPYGIRQPTLQRLATLPLAARQVVEAAAVLQSSVPVSVLLRTASLEDDPEAVDLALGSGLLVARESTIGFRHAFAAQAVYEQLGVQRRERLHSRSADALGELPSVPLGQLAHHLKHARREADWADAAELAATQALRLGHVEEAARLLEDVVRHAPLEPVRRAYLAVELGWAAIDTLHASQVADVLSEVLSESLPRPLYGELSFLLGHVLNTSAADLPRQYALFQTAFECMERPELRTWAAAALGIPVTPGVSLAEHLGWVRRAVALADGLADQGHRVNALGKAGSVLLEVGDPEWRAVVTRVARLTGDAPRLRGEVNAHYSLGLSACYAGQLDTARRLLATGLQAPLALESTRLDVLLRSGSVLLAFFEGRWDGLGAEVSSLLGALAEYPRNRIDVELVEGLYALALADHSTASRRLSEVFAQAQAIRAHQTLPVAGAGVVRLALARGDISGALAAATVVVADLADKGVWAPVGWALPSLVEAFVAAGDLSAARALVASASSALVLSDSPLASAAVSHSVGLLDSSSESLVSAASSYDSVPAPYFAALARERAAALLLPSEPAAKLLEQAAATFHQLGATWDHDRVARLARTHGLRVKPRTTRSTRTTTLTPREQQVAELVSTGSTNRQIARELFLSEKTVDKHVTAAMRKLDVHSRLQLARHLDRLHPGT